MDMNLSGPKLSVVSWGPVIAGALVAVAFGATMLSFGAALGLSIASSSPSWRDASAALALLSGIYLIFQSMVSFGIGGYIAGRARVPHAAAKPEDVERTDGLNGLTCWAIAVVLGAIIGAFIATAGAQKIATNQTSAAEPLLSYELDRMFRSPRRITAAETNASRAEAGRILLTSASHAGMTPEDRQFLVATVAAVGGLQGPDAERRTDDIIDKSRLAISTSRGSQSENPDRPV